MLIQEETIRISMKTKIDLIWSMWKRRSTHGICSGETSIKVE